MIRTQIQFSEDQLHALKSRAAREHVSVSALVRKAVEAWVTGNADVSQEERRRRAVEAAGRFASGTRDVARKHDEYLVDAFHP